MKAARVGAALLLSILVPSAGIAQSTDPDSLVDLPSPPPGYYWGAPVALPDTLIEVRDSSRLGIEITRAGADEFESRLIEMAERLHLLEDSMSVLVPLVPGPAAEGVELRRMRLHGPDRWWWKSAGSVLVPFAVTGSAVRYYLDQVRTAPSLLANFRGRPDALRYAAGVRGVEAGGGAGFEVELSLSVQVHCGDHCRLRFEHRRTVVFDSTGAPISVDGDGPIRYSISTASPGASPPRPIPTSHAPRVSAETPTPSRSASASAVVAASGTASSSWARSSTSSS